MRAPGSRGVYLLCFAGTPLHHAKHYLGYADDISRRLEEHAKGRGARLTEVLKERGIEWELVRVWEGATRAEERALKNRRDACALCPRCRKERAARSAATQRRAYWARKARGLPGRAPAGELAKLEERIEDELAWVEARMAGV